MHKPNTISLQRLRTRTGRSPWGTRLLAAWAVLSLLFAFTPCCDVIGLANAAPAPVATDRDHGADAHGGGHASDGGDRCATWLDRSDAVPVKADEATPPGAQIALATLFVFSRGAASVSAVWRPFRLSASPPHALYLRHARLIL